MATETGEFYSAPVGASPFEPRSVQCNRGRVAQELLPSSSRTRLGADARRVPGVTMDDGLPSGPVATGRVPRACVFDAQTFEHGPHLCDERASLRQGSR